MSNENKIPFQLIQGRDEKIKELSPMTGYLYFATDTKKIYCEKNGHFIPMGGDVSVFYGNKYIEPDNSGNTPDPIVIFDSEDIDGQPTVCLNDLILNSDGCFYKVTLVDENGITTTRLTLQGTGGGSTGPSEGGGSAQFRITNSGGSKRYFSLESEQAYLGMIGYSSDSENYISTIELSWDKDFEDIFYIQELTWPMETPYEKIDIKKYLSELSTSGTRIYLRATDKYGSTRSFFYTVAIASLQLKPETVELFSSALDTFDYQCTVGGSLELDERYIQYDLYVKGKEEPISLGKQNLTSVQSGKITKTLNLSEIEHGDYTLKVQLIGSIGGTLIYSNILTHKLLRYKESVGQAIFSALIPERVEQYSPFSISYLLAYGNTSRAYEMDIIINDNLLTSQEIYAEEVKSYTLTLDARGTYDIELSIAELGVSYKFELEVEKYTGNLPVIDIDRDDLKICLTANGKTNNDVEKEKWKDAKNNTIHAELSNFYYRTINGWIKENEKDCLRVSQNACVELKSYTPFAVSPKTNGFTVELDFLIKGVFDYDANFIECLSYSPGENETKDIKTGFVVKGDCFKYYASGKELVSLNLVEGKRIKLSFVIEPSNSNDFPMCYAFLNGIISKAINYSSTYDFANNPQYPAYLKINSTGGEIDVYNIRFYSTALDAHTVLNNYQATIDNLEEREFSYRENAIRDLYGEISLKTIEDENYNLQIPYVKITGGYAANKSFKMADKHKDNKPNLPVGKKDYRSIDIEIIYPKVTQNSYFAGYKNLKVTTTFDDPLLNVINGFGNTPNVGAMMYAQGTSSLEYPVKNLRVKLKGDKFVVRPDIAPVELITFKADFMESSGSHNTGAANFIDATYLAAGLKTPGQEHFADNEDVGTIVTCIKGHPCVIFWNPGVDENGNELSRIPENYQFIGKYNLNLDKATPEPFGFMNDDNDETFGYEVDENGQLIRDEKGNKINSIYCFEFLDNNEKVCNFMSDKESTYIDYDAETDLSSKEDIEYDTNNKTEQERFRDSWYSKRINEENEIVPGWARGFESRYPEDQIKEQDADALWPFASWLNDLYVMRYGVKKCSDCGFEFTFYSGNTCNKCGSSNVTYKVAAQEQAAIKKFKNEYQQYLDTDYLLAYYLITETLLMADSRVKNMMIATWGKEHKSWIDSDKVSHSTYDYVWYPIFYDMDTMLGLDNIGYTNKYYYDEDTQEDVFNGDEILWKFVRDALGAELAKKYEDFEQTAKAFLKDNILPYFNDNQGDMANETFYNEDAFYKYIDTFRNGYTNHLTGDYVEPGTGSRLYAAQGNRSMAREYFVENRLRYLRGKYKSTNFQEGDRIEFRLTYPKTVTIPDVADEDLTPEQLEAKLTNISIAAVPPSGEFNYTSSKTGYAGVKVGTASDHHRYVNEENYPLTVDTTSGNGTETYLMGVSNLSDVGDLSNKYLYKLILKIQENNLRRLILGNHHRDYFNPYWKDETLIKLSGFRFLEEFNLENCKTFTGEVDFTGSPKVKTILLNGSQVSSLKLPVGGVIEELRIPDSLTNFSIEGHPTLMNDKFTIGYFDYDENKYINNFRNLSHISIKNTPNIDSYGILKSALLESSVTRLETYCFQDIAWEITDPNDFDYSDQKVSGIKVLDKLHSDLTYYDGVRNEAEALTGTLTINAPGISVNEFEIYQKYQSIYPNLTILYGDNISFERAVKIKFYNVELENFKETIEPYYTVLSNGNQNLQFLTSAEGPNGIKLSDPVKVSTNEFDYFFLQRWVNIDDPSEIITVSSFVAKTPTEDLRLAPMFEQRDRNYTLIFYNYDKSLISSFLTCHWDQPIIECLTDEQKYLINYYSRPEDDLSDHERWAFAGWRTKANFNGSDEVEFVDLTTKNISGDLELYAHYVKENARTTASNGNYFYYSDININGEDGYKININEDLRYGFKGKLTIPSKYNGKNILSIGNFVEISNITHVFFLSDSVCKEIADNGGFRCDSENLSQLKIVELPNSIVKIGDGAFCNCLNLTDINLNNNIEEIGIRAFGVSNEYISYDSTRKMQVKISSLPNNLKILGDHAFYHGGDNITIRILPSGLETIDMYTFVGCPNLQINIIGLEGYGENISSVGAGAFNDSGYHVSSLQIGPNVELDVESGWMPLFEGYGSKVTGPKVFTAYKEYSINALFGPDSGWTDGSNVG